MGMKVELKEEKNESIKSIRRQIAVTKEWMVCRQKEHGNCLEQNENNVTECQEVCQIALMEKLKKDFW